MRQVATPPGWSQVENAPWGSPSTSGRGPRISRMSPLPTFPQTLPLRVFALHRRLRQVLYHAQNQALDGCRAPSAASANLCELEPLVRCPCSACRRSGWRLPPGFSRLSRTGGYCRCDRSLRAQEVAAWQNPRRQRLVLFGGHGLALISRRARRPMSNSWGRPEAHSRAGDSAAAPIPSAGRGAAVALYRSPIDLDIENYFGSISHSHLRSFLDQRRGATTPTTA
jgi:hypothetical protein